MEADHIAQLEILKKAVTELDKRFDSQDEKLDKVFNAIIGDEKFGNTGLVKRIERLENIEQKWSRFQYKAVGIIAGVTVVWEVFKTFIDFKFK